MDHVSIDAAEALSGEEAFILQLRPPAPPGADEAALAERVDQFTGLYLTGAAPANARFARLAPLTWAIAAGCEHAARVEAMRADLCETLFGADDPERAQLARQPSAFDTDFDAGPTDSPPAAAPRAPYEEEDDTFDIDSAMLDIDDSDVFEVDSWRLSEPAEPARAAEPAADVFEDEEAGEPSDVEDADIFSDAQPQADVLDALAELERAFKGESADPEGEAPDAVTQWAADEETGAAEESDLAILDDDAPEGDEAASAADSEAFDIQRFEADLDAFEAQASAEVADPDGPALSDEAGAADAEEDAWEPAVSSAPEPAPVAPAPETDAEDLFESLTEAPAPRSGDLASELAAFRQEMRAIAEAIPGAGAGDALDRFREEVDAIAGSLGQRVDGAAQRIEAAADRMVEASGAGAAGRLDGAAERAERSAEMLDASIQEAVRALKAALAAGGEPGPQLAAHN